jgi:hypothetical protein
VNLFDNPHRLSPPTGYVRRLDPRMAGALAQAGYDPDDYRQRLNESTRRRLETVALGEGVDAIDGEYRVVE